jgi:CHAT domain-containing protein
MYNSQILWKGILFKDNQKIKHNILSSNNPDLLATFKKWQDTKETLARLYAFSILELNDMGMLVEELEEQVRNYEKDLSKNCNIFEKSIHRPQIIWQDIQKGLKEDEAMVEIVCFDYFRNDWTDTTIYLALIITKESKDYPDFVVLDKDNMLEKNYLKGYYRGIEGQIQDDSDKELYNVFWGSIEKIIPGKKKIYLCPDGIYNNINLNTLTDMTDKYFIDKYELVLLSNSSSILEKNIQSDNSDKLKTANLFGFPGSNIQYSDQKEYIRSLELISDKFEFSDLPNTKVEIQLIDSLLINNGYETKVFLRKEANEKRFKEIQNTDLLHIATHGIFLSDDKLESYDKIYGIDVDRFIDNPLLRSGLLLTAKDNENGILTAYEVKDMNFEGTKLVVLSACETGSGKILNGEGIFGLQRAFLMAGSEAVIMTLWKVEDKATQKLMVIFYKKWLSGLSVREALKKAQIEIKNEGQPPFFWGAFVVVGE